MSKVDMWTDGGCRPNPGVGGWGVVLETADALPVVKVGRKINGRIDRTTSQRAELQALISGIEALKGGPHEVLLHTDSTYLTLAIRGMKRPTSNVDLLNKITELKRVHTITVKKVKGHAKEKNNLVAHALVQMAMSGTEIDTYY